MQKVKRSSSGVAAAICIVLATLSRADSAALLPVYAPTQEVLRLPPSCPDSPSCGPDDVAAADFNCDGLTDIVATRLHFGTTETFPLSILLNDGHGGFIDATATIISGPVPRLQHPRRILIADFNNDGRPDVFIADHGQDALPFPGYQNTLLLSTPDCKLIDATSSLPQQSDFTHSVAAADIDGSGTLSLYVGNHIFRPEHKSPPQIWVNDGSGHFTVAAGRLPPQITGAGSGGAFTASHFVDVNNDGYPDLTLGGAGGSSTPSIVLLNDGRGRFSVLHNALPPKPFAPTDVTLEILSTDLNHDGFQDLLMGFTKQEPFYKGRWIQVLINNGDGTFRDETAIRLPQIDNNDPWLRVITLVDIDGDGHLDIVGRQAEGGPINPLFFHNNGDGVFTPVDISLHSPNAGDARVFTLLDADGDGGRDFFFGISANPPADVFRVTRQMNPVSPPGPVTEIGATRGNFQDRVRLTWRYVWGATQYEVWRSTSLTSPGTLIGTTKNAGFDDTGAGIGEIYQYSVRALNAAGVGPYGGRVQGYRGGATPAVGFTLNRATFGSGDVLRGDLFKANPGQPVAVDLYIAVLLPPSAGPAFNCSANDPIVFVTDTSVVVTCVLAPETFKPFASNVVLEGGLPLAITGGVVNFTWPSDAPPGSYLFAVALTQPGTLNVIGLAVDSAGFSP